VVAHGIGAASIISGVVSDWFVGEAMLGDKKGEGEVKAVEVKAVEVDQNAIEIDSESDYKVEEYI